jgi:hypothetical protein
MIATSKRVKSQTYRSALAAAVVLSALALPKAHAFAFSDSVMDACASDYLTYCSSYDVDSPKVRSCMRSVGTKLSQGCINALVASGEVSKSEVARRSASQR